MSFLIDMSYLQVDNKLYIHLVHLEYVQELYQKDESLLNDRKVHCFLPMRYIRTTNDFHDKNF